ncbi:peptidase M48 [Luteitalea sp. TBR-22]|uniref:M48 family metalloprotease n=1 Tax=Luteitalea sp. TBR-22 TaxID=2802971 RepID=UPI001AF3FBFA|nr:M48 family metallopeptidase [Luteitalea sp. TBR-22]BCS32858.1 peptidase M48 [Luteitalea sp. TBR-22]
MPTILSRVARSTTAITLAVAMGSGSVAAVALLSVQDEIQMGREAQAELLREVPVVRDHGVRQYVDGLGRELAGYASGADYPYSFTTADYRDLNAFALPGGPIWINRGVLDAAENEAQVAGVLAHEIAHVSQRHSARHMTKSLVTTGILWAIAAAIDGRDDDWRAQAVNLAAMVTASSVLLKFSRNDEKQADREGVRILEQAGYDPRGLLEFMQMLDAQQGRSPNAVARFFSTHPDPKSRVRDLGLLIADAEPGRRDSAEFSALKQRLSRLGPAQPMP